MEQDKIKDAFQKVKQDIEDLKYSLNTITTELYDLKLILNEINRNSSNKPINQQTDTQHIPQINHINPTDGLNEHYNYPLEALKDPNTRFSTGNRGVPTNRQTNQQTDRHMILQGKIEEKAHINTQNPLQSTQIDRLQMISQALESLDSIKKELRHQFKQLTAQEMLVFSTIYQLEDEGFTVDYPIIASKLSLSESSIRDYVIKINKKHLLISKIKQNNKKIILKIPSQLRQLASLQTLLTLREL
ncbi:MAG: hypothetical protein AABX35_02545 [Nanoarchaeota archaeon]